MPSIDISIILSNYNYSQYIDDALKSIQQQSLQNWECIIIDDGSTDNSVDIIKKYVKTDKRFKLIKQKHAGVSAARNAGLDVAKGDYIAFLDSDDCFTECALEMLLQFAKSTNADMVGGKTSFVAENFKFVKSGKPSWSQEIFGGINDPVRYLLLPQQHKWCWIWRRIYKRSLIGDTRFAPEFVDLGDDLTFMLDICHKAKTIIESNNISVFHRIHSAAVTNSDFDSHFFDFFPKYFKYIKENVMHHYDERFLKLFYRNSFEYLITETMIKPKELNKLQLEAKKVLIESCKYIPLHYLSFKQKLLCRFLRWLK